MKPENKIVLNESLLPVLFFFGRIILYLGMESRNLNGYGDFQTYFQIAGLKGFPFFSYWVEFPPVFPFINALIFRLSSGQQVLFDFILFLIITIAGAGSILFFWRIDECLHGGEERGIGTIIYFALLVCLPYTWWYYDMIPVLFMLMGIYWAIENKPGRTGVVIAAGILTKWFPLFLLAPIWRFGNIKNALKITITALGITALVLGGLYILSPSLTAASLVSQPFRSSWETIWAVIDGNFKTGLFISPQARLDPATAWSITGNPPVISPWIRLVIFGAIGLWFYWKVKVRDKLSFVSFSGITWLVFLTWSSGWSPQWVLYLIPLILLALPLQKALLWEFGLILLAVIEWPTLLGHYVFAAVVPLSIIRTALFILLAVQFYKNTQKSSLESDNQVG